MNNFAAYTPLESLLLFQGLAAHGADAAGFAQVSQLLRNNSFIRDDPAYDPARLGTDALRDLFRYLVAEELKSETAPRENGEGGLSPNSKKRKLQSPPLPTVKEVLDQFDKIPALVEKIYARYQEDVIRKIHRDDQRLLALSKEIQLLEEAERKEREERAAKAEQEKRLATQNVTTTTKSAHQNGPRFAPYGASPASAQTPVPVPTPGSRASPAGAQQISADRRNIAPSPAGAHAFPTAPPPRASPVPTATKAQQPQKGAQPHGQVLQPPVGAGQPHHRPLQSTSPVPLPAISPRPDPSKPKTPGSVPSPQPSSPGALKWEKPYHPGQAAAQGRGAPPPPPPPPQGTATHPSPSGQPQPQGPPQWHAQPAGTHPAQQPLQPSPQPPANRPSQDQRASSQPRQPVLAPPQQPAQVAPPHLPAAGRGTGERPVGQQAQTHPPSTTPVTLPVPPTAKPSPAQQQPPKPGQHTPVQARPIQAAVPPASAGATAQKPAQQHPQSPASHAQQPSGVLSPSPQIPAQQADAVGRVGSPYTNQPPRLAIPPHIASQLPSSPSPVQRTSSAQQLPKTPAASSPTFVLTGSGTKWTAKSTPSTPRPPVHGGEIPSPVFEPLSPVQQSARLPAPGAPQEAKEEKKKPSPKSEPADRSARSKEPKTTRPRGRPSRSAQKDAAEATPSRATAPPRRSQSVTSQADELSLDDHELAPRVKDEEATPRPSAEVADAMVVDESSMTRRRMVTPGSVSSRMAQKRKRHDTPVVEALPPASTPTHVLWTRQFGKISSSALDQISSHRCANQFAHPIRERDAPGYRDLVLQPQDIKSVRAAMTHGNRAAVEAAKALPGGDPGTPTVWLPISDELLPPRSIINSEQLERELVHMFSNAIMYNLDPLRGPGASFVKGAGLEHDDEAEPSTYQIDEDAVVRDSRIMFVEVERLLGDLRAAERDRSGLPPSSATGSARPTSVAATPAAEGGTPTAQTGQAATDEDLDELAAEEAGSTSKRRRLGTRA